jgi:hypothetical protein
MRNTLSKTVVAGVAALSLTASLFATAEPANAAFRYGGGGFHAGGFGWRGGGWGGGWWAPAVIGGVAAGALLAAPFYGYGYGRYCGYGCGYGYPGYRTYPGYAYYPRYRVYPGYGVYTRYRAYPGYAYPGYAYNAAPYTTYGYRY